MRGQTHMRRPLPTHHTASPGCPFPPREGGWGLGLPPLPFLPPPLPFLAMNIAIFAAILPLLPPSRKWHTRQTRLKSGISADHALEKIRKAAKTAMFTKPVNIAASSHPIRAACQTETRERLATCYTGVPPTRPSYPPTASLSPRPLTGQDKKGPSPCPTSPPPSRPTTTTSPASG